MTKRKMLIEEEKWQYKIGRRNVVIWSPGGQKEVVSFELLLGDEEVKRRSAERRQYLEERCEENNYRGFSITPRDVRVFIDAVVKNHHVST